MQLQQERVEPTKVKFTITAEQSELDKVKQHVLRDLAKTVKVPGFRPGKAPTSMIEKQIDASAMQSEFLEHAVNDLYGDAINQGSVKAIAPPQISVIKFVPYSTLEFSAEVEAIGDIELPDYKNIKLPQKPIQVTAADVNGVIDNLRQRAASKSEVKRAAKQGDEVVIDFKGADAKTKDLIEGTEGSAYPLTLGSNSFIPGFEDELIGLKAAEKKDFDIVFPKDYNVASLQNREVTFSVKVIKVSELAEPKADDKFAKSVGPFKTISELKDDVKKQLKAEKQRESDREYDNVLLEKIASKTTVAIPDSLIEEEIDRMEEEEKRNIVYRGQTWQEHLDEERLTAEQHRDKQRGGAELRVKGGLILGEISQAERISVSPDELDLRIKLLKGQYTDPVMQAELDKPENRRDVLSRLLTEKTLDKLRSYSKN